MVLPGTVTLHCHPFFVYVFPSFFSPLLIPFFLVYHCLISIFIIDLFIGYTIHYKQASKSSFAVAGFSAETSVRSGFGDKGTWSTSLLGEPYLSGDLGEHLTFTAGMGLAVERLTRTSTPFCAGRAPASKCSSDLKGLYGCFCIDAFARSRCQERDRSTFI